MTGIDEVYALSEDGALTSRGVADELRISVNLAATRLFKLYTAGRLVRQLTDWGYLYTRPDARS